VFRGSTAIANKLLSKLVEYAAFIVLYKVNTLVLAKEFVFYYCA
jgi:hypothetical protein